MESEPCRNEERVETTPGSEVTGPSGAESATRDESSETGERSVPPERCSTSSTGPRKDVLQDSVPLALSTSTTSETKRPLDFRTHSVSGDLVGRVTDLTSGSPTRHTLP